MACRIPDAERADSRPLIVIIPKVVDKRVQVCKLHSEFVNKITSVTKIMKNSEQHILKAEHLGLLLERLIELGYRVIGPRVRNGSLVLDEVQSVEQFPVGRITRQEPGLFRLEETGRTEYFSCIVGQQSWKRYLQKPRTLLYESMRFEGSLEIRTTEADPQKRAFIGVRPCDLAAIKRQDKILIGGEYVDTAYRARRNELFIVAVNCTRPGGTCFCESMGTGPQAHSGFDLVLTELCSYSRQDFVVEAGSEAGREMLGTLQLETARPEDIDEVELAVDAARRAMGRKLETDGLPERLNGAVEDPYWEKIAERCLNCSNCTLVCPTCFCTTIEDRTDLSGETASRTRVWDSCFTLDHSYIYGGSVRQSGWSRYRQWLMHKLSWWFDQFGESGCVGCGRCITWCPVGIDITAEAEKLASAGEEKITSEARR